VGEVVLRFVAALWHVAGVIILVVLFTEFGVDWLRRRIRRLRRGRTTRPARSAGAEAYGGADWTTPYFDEFSRLVRVDWKEHVGWWQRPHRGEYVTIDERGLRATPGEREAGPGAMRILCFGGSTMMGMGARDAHTIPAVLARRLADLGHAAAVTNMGQLGYNNTQETIALQQLLKRGERPDIVLFYDGINEMVCAEQTGAPDRVMHEAARRAEFNIFYTDRRADLVKAGLIAAMPRTVRRLRELTGLPLRGPLPAGRFDLTGADIPALARDVVEAYAANLRLIRLLAGAYKFQALFFWQPVITTKRDKTEDERFFESEFTGALDARRRLFAAVIDARRRHPELAQAADCIDLSRLFDDRPDPVYIDLYHLSEAGNAAVAEAMLSTVAAAVAGLQKSVGSAPPTVIPGLVPGIHVDGRDKPGHDD
jgi:lysophospholipase L1-like esterase